MKHIIKIECRPIGNSQPEIQVVNARDLHAFLGVETKFADWIKRRIDEYEFTEHIDFSIFLNSEKNPGLKPTTEYHITLDMAKELAMVERNEKGKQARQYFIACERKAHAALLKPRLPTKRQLESFSVLYDIVARVPGVKPELAAAQTLATIKLNTGLEVEPMRLALPAKIEPQATLNATRLGERIGLSARAMNLKLEEAGLQFKNERGEWELTEEGKAFGEALPYVNGGHSGYQILWKEELALALAAPEGGAQ